MRKIISAILLLATCTVFLAGCRSSELSVKDLYFTYENGEKIPDGVDMEVDFEGSVISYQLYWKLETRKGENVGVRFVSDTDKVIVSDSGLVTFLDVNAVARIAVIADNGSGKKDVITLVPILKGGEIEVY